MEGSADDGALAEAVDGRHWAFWQFLPIPVLLLDRTGIIEQANTAFSSMVGGSHDRLHGMPFSSRILREHRPLFRKHLGRCRASGDARIAVELNLRASNDEVIPVRVVSERAVRETEAYWTAVLDLRDQRRLEAERAALQDFQKEAKRAAESRDLFVAVLSHELRSPLAAITAAASTLQGGRTELLDLPRLGALIGRAAAAQARLIEDLSDLIHLNRGTLALERVPTDLHTIVEDAVQTFAGDIAGKSLALDVELKASQHVVSADATRLRQVFWNLVKNAIKFTPSGGRIGLRSWNGASNVVLEVSDTGHGIAPEMLTRIFERFEQASPGAGGGLGLGLPIAKGIVERLHGKLTAASAGLGKGARFVVEFPITISARDAGSAPTQPAQSSSPPTHRPRILVVEDNADLAEVMALVLENAGYTTTRVDSLTTARTVDLTRIALVLSDINLPDGNGRELVRWIHERRPIPAIAMSGMSSDADEAASREAGFLLHLKKPVDIDNLLPVIQQALKPPTPLAGAPPDA